MNVYKTKGTCSTSIAFDIKDNRLTNVTFERGCSGNLEGLSALVEGMLIDDVIEKLKGIKCGFKDTSCPDQLATALEKYRSKTSL